MKPSPNVRLQAAGAFLVALAALAVLSDVAALTVAITTSVGAAIWLLFAGRYRLRRRAAGEGVGDVRSEHRRVRDRVMVQNLVVGLLVPAVLAWIEVALGGVELLEPPVDGGLAVLLTLAAILFPLSMLVSSAVDWYVIRAFREGVYAEPACRAARWEGHAGDTTIREEAGNHTMYWVLHRMVSEGTAFVSVVFLVGVAFVIAGDATHSTRGQNVLNAVGFLGIGVWGASQLPKLQTAYRFLRAPTPGIGLWVEGRNGTGRLDGFALDISLAPGLQLLEEPVGIDARDRVSEERSIPLENRDTIHEIEAPRPICRERCEFWIQHCERGLREDEARRRREEERRRRDQEARRRDEGSRPGRDPLPAD